MARGEAEKGRFKAKNPHDISPVYLMNSKPPVFTPPPQFREEYGQKGKEGQYKKSQI
jgi:hypothetical protein